MTSLKDNNYKAQKKYTWKKWGIIIPDFETLWEEYLNTTNCKDCDVYLEGLGINCKCLDHDHKTGLVRDIVCRNCNNKRSIVDNKEKVEKNQLVIKEREKERNRLYRLEHKEHIKQIDREYYIANSTKIKERTKK